MSFYDEFKNPTKKVEENIPEEKNIIQKAIDFVLPKKQQPIENIETPKKSIFDQYQDEANPPKQSNFTDVMAELGLRQGGYQDLENKGKLTPELSAMEKAGFSAPTQELPVIEKGGLRLDPNLKISQGNFGDLKEPTAEETKKNLEYAYLIYPRQKKFNDMLVEEMKKPSKAKPDYVEPKGFFGQFREGLKFGIESMKSTPGYFAETLGMDIGSKEMIDWGQEFADRQTAKLYNNPDLFRPEKFDTTRGWVGRVMGEQIPIWGTMLTTSILGGLVGGPGGAVTGGFSSVYALEQANAYKNMLDRGIAPDKASQASKVYGVISSAIENMFGYSPAKIGQGLVSDQAEKIIVNSFKDFLIKELPNVGKTMLRKSFEEGAEEATQQLTQNLITKWYDQSQPVWDGVAQSFLEATVSSLPMGATDIIDVAKKVKITKEKIDSTKPVDILDVVEQQAEQKTETKTEPTITNQNQPKTKFVYSDLEPQTPEEIHAENELVKTEQEKIINAETGKPLELTGWNTSVGNKDSGFRSPDRYESQAYYSDKFQFSNEGIVNVNKTTDKLENPFVADSQSDVLKYLNREDRLKISREEVAKTNGLRPSSPVVIENDNIIRTELLKQGYDGVVYKNGNRRPEWQVFNIKKKLTSEKQTMKELKTVEDYDTEIERQIDDFRKEYDLMASNEGAGVRYYKSDQTGGEERLYSYFKLDRAKSDMYERAEQAKKYANNLLYENNAEFRKIVDARDKLREEQINNPNYVDPNEIDVSKMFDEISQEETKINEFANSVEKLIEAQPEEVGKNEGAKENVKKENDAEQSKETPKEIIEITEKELIDGAIKFIKDPKYIIDKMTPLEYNNAWEDFYNYIQENVDNLNAKEINKLENELETIKNTKTKESKARVKIIKEKLNRYNDDKNSIGNNLEESWIANSVELSELANKTAENAGVNFTEESAVDFRDEFSMRITDNAYAESLWQTPIKDVLADMIEEYKTPKAEFTEQEVKTQKAISEITKGEEKPKKKKSEFNVGDMIDTQGKSNMVSPVTIREITGNTIKFTDADGTEFGGMARSDVRNLIANGEWKKFASQEKPLDVEKEIEAEPISDEDAELKKLFGEIYELQNPDKVSENWFTRNQNKQGSEELGKVGLENASLKIKYKKQGGLFLPKERLSTPYDIAFLFKQLENEAVEHSFLVGTKNNKPIFIEPISIGTIDSALISPFEPIDLLLKKNATGFWVIHNHPSGNVEASEADIMVMTRLKKGYEGLGLRFDGGIIINHNKFGHIDKDFDFKELPMTTGKKGEVVNVYKKEIKWLSKAETKSITTVDDVVVMMQGLAKNIGENYLITYLNSRNEITASEIVSYEKLNVKNIVSSAVNVRSKSVMISHKSKVDNSLLVGLLNRELKELDIDLVDVVAINKKGITESAREQRYLNDKNSRLSFNEQNGTYQPRDKQNQIKERVEKIEKLLLGAYEKKYGAMPRALFDVSKYPSTNKIEVAFYSKETDRPEMQIFDNISSVLEAMKEYQDENGNKYSEEINAGIMGKSKEERQTIYNRNEKPLTQPTADSIIKNDEQQPTEQLNRDIGETNKPTELPETLPMGGEQPTDTGGATAISSGQDARGGSRNGNDLSGERLELSKRDQVEINSQIEKLVADKGDNSSSYTEDEKNLLSQYSGYGGLEQGGAENRGLLDEYFTPQKVVSFVWSKVNNLLSVVADNKTTQKIVVEKTEEGGKFILQTIKDGKIISKSTFSTMAEAESEMTPVKENKISILEPAVGTGNFINEAPENSSIDAYEINETSAKITKILYPNANVNTISFERLFIDDRGNKSRWIGEYQKKGLYNLVIGNPPYGEHRGIYKGLGEEPKIAKYEEYFLKRSLDITKEGGIVAMVVPSGFLRSDTNYAKVEISKLGKLVDAYRLPNNTFDNTSIGTDIVIFQKETITDLVGGGTAQRYNLISGNKYFDKNPDKILGVEKERKGRFGGMEKYVEGSLDFIPEQVKEIEKVVEVNDPTETKTEKQDIVNAIENEIESGAIINEKEFVKNWSKKDVNQASLFDPMPKFTGTIKATTEQGTPANKNKSIIMETPKKTSGILDLSEYYKDKSDKEIMTYTEIEATGEVKDRLLKSEFSDEASKLAYLNFMNGKWYNNFNYFSGDIYEKLDNLEINKDRISKAQYDKQKKGLMEVMPERQTIDRIYISPNTPFADMNINYNGKSLSLKRAFIEFLDSLPRDSFSDVSKWEIKEYVLEQSVRGSDKVRNQVVRVKRREAGNRFFSMFLKEGLELPQRNAVEEEYNRRFNSYAKTDYRDVPLFSKIHGTFKGETLNIKDYQLQGIGFLVNKGIGLIAHDVGLGKTMQTIIAMNETMKRGWAKRPLVVVPSGNMYSQWIKEIQELLPDIKITGLANLGGEFKGDLGTLEIEDGTISVITYEGFKKLGFKDDTYYNLTKDLQDTIGDTGDMTERKYQKERAKVEETIGKGKKGTKLEKSFEDLGFDLLTIDEVQNANHIVKGAKMLKEDGKASEFRGLTVRPSELGVKAWLATQYILKNNNGRNVFLASATPFTNNPMEYYSILSLLARERLSKSGLKNVNEFMNTFMDISFDFEITADGNYKERNNIKGFKNYQQFQKLLTEFIDFRDGEEVGIKRPERISVETVLKPTATQMDLVNQAQVLFTDKELKGGILKGVGEMRAIAFSPYASSYYRGQRPTYKEFVENSPKIKAMVELVKQNKKDNKEANQVVYSPIGVEYFPFIKDYLVREVGFKPDEVGIITGSVKASQRVEIQEKFNDGKVKIILGSDAIQEGVNLQRKSTDLYILSLPWNFTELKQIAGRVWRQGNEWKNIRIHNLFIENSVDVFQAQKLETKQSRYENSLKYKGDYLDVGDIDFDELKLDLIKSPTRRVSIEKAQETKRRERALNEAKSDLGFYSRKAKKLAELQEKVSEEMEGLEDYRNWAKKEKEDGDANNYWGERLVDQENRVNRYKAEYEIAKKEAEEKGLINNDQIEMLTKNVENAQKQVDNINKEFETKENQAKADEDIIIQEIRETTNDYAKVASDLATQNKTFFVKSEFVQQKKAKRSPSGMASTESSKLGNFEQLSEPDEVDKLKIFEEVKALIKKYAKTVGEGYLPSGAVGVLYPSDNIRIKGMNALSVATHEITHFLDRVFKISDQLMGIKGYSENGMPIYEKETRLFRKEMTNLYEKYYPTAKRTHKLRKRMTEGFATLLEKYIEQPTMISKEYPNLVAEFLQTGGTFYEPVIGEIINDVKEIISRYQKLSPLDKIGARVINNKVNVDKDSFLNFKDRIKTFIADNIYPIEKLAKVAGVHFTKLDPSLWLRQYNNSNAIIVNNIKQNKGYWGWRNGNIEKLYSYNWHTLVEDMEKSKVSVDFGNYLVARNEYFLYQELQETNNKITEIQKKIESNVELSDLEKAEFQELKEKADNTASILENDGFTEQEVRQAYEAGQDKYVELESMFDNLVREDLNFLYDNQVQLIDQDQYLKLTSRRGYASMKRVFYDEVVGEEGGVALPKKVGGVKASSLLARKGSERPILHPVNSAMLNHAEMTRKGLKQIVYNRIGDISSKMPDLFQELQLKVLPDTNGVLRFPQEKDPNIIMTRKNYKRKPILVDKIIKKSVDDILTHENINIFEKILVGSSRFFTKGTTGLFPAFAISNYTIDQITATAQTRNNYIPLYTPLKELTTLLNPRKPEHKYALEYLVGGGERQTFVGWQDLAPNELFEKINNERTGILKAIDLLNSGMDIFAIPSKYSEIMTRMSEYIKSRQAGKPYIVAIEEAGRVTAPFHHTGSWGGGRIGKTFIKSIPFFNPSIQVLAQSLETLNTQSGRNRYLFVMLAVIASSIASAIALVSGGSDDQKKLYADLTPNEMAGYIYLPNPNGKSLIKAFRVPEQMNFIATIINMAIIEKGIGANYSAGEYVDAGTAWIPAQFNITQPIKMFMAWIPQLIKPGALTIAGVKDFPKIMPLESMSQKNKLPENRVNETTSPVAKQLGKLLGLSPIKIDYLLTGYLGRSVGFLTGKPGIYNPFKNMSREYYFESGRKMQQYYDLKSTNDQRYNDYKDGRIKLSNKEIQTLMTERNKLKSIQKTLKTYDTINPDKQPKTLKIFRDKILSQIEEL